ncbi:MAG: NAD(P)H-binding protein [Mycobacteriaceae bacterium]|nr:NAD(P)H-binding protein [Mycobacteriaceae bacterium]
MTKIIVFGAGGRAGRAIVAAASRRGYEVTAVVRDPGRHPDLEAVAGDVTDPQSVARRAAGHDLAVHAAGEMSPTFFPAAASALLDGLAAAGVGRLIVVGLSANLRDGGGTLIRDAPEFPDQFRDFARSHAAGTDLLAGAPPALDWAVLCPAGDFDHGGADRGRYAFAPPDAANRITYGDFAIAVVDQIAHPAVSRAYQGTASA